MNNDFCLDYWGYMHGKRKKEYNQSFFTLNEVFKLNNDLNDKDLRAIIGTDDIKIKVHNGYDLLIIKDNEAFKHLTDIYTLRAISEMKFYIK